MFKSDLPPKQKINKKFKATLNTKKARPTIQSDQVSIDEASPDSTSNLATPSKRKITQKSKAVVKDKRSKLSIHDDPIPINERMDYVIPVKDQKTAKHVDVFFYHLRKKLKSNLALPRVTVDSTFQSRLSTLFETTGDIMVDEDIARIIKGDIIGCNIP
ncbi:uncharacterized protein LOC141668099 [Apium graveolens]|uniref:uncharacterized protein LOC141668099 n=1 Tax=Apium graveolens TaxID=4045 RepID=UPI003D78D027